MEVQGYQPPQAVYLGADGRRARRRRGASGPAAAVARVRWAGVESTLLRGALCVPPERAGRGRAARASTLPGGEDGEPRAGAGGRCRRRRGPALLYVGPKDHHALPTLGHGLVEVVPGRGLDRAHRGARSWRCCAGSTGTSATTAGRSWLLTVLINLVMAPFRHYSIANGMKMAKLAPEMRVIQERYRKVPALDPSRQEMQKEIGELYARHGMSMGTQMAVGCLPLLLTMPFLIAFYRVLQVSIELRGASLPLDPRPQPEGPALHHPRADGRSRCS